MTVAPVVRDLRRYTRTFWPRLQGRERAGGLAFRIEDLGVGGRLEDHQGRPGVLTRSCPSAGVAAMHHPPCRT
jgi:hypothetical protein